MEGADIDAASTSSHPRAAAAGRHGRDSAPHLEGNIEDGGETTYLGTI